MLPGEWGWGDWGPASTSSPKRGVFVMVASRAAQANRLETCLPSGTNTHLTSKELEYLNRMACEISTG